MKRIVVPVDDTTHDAWTDEKDGRTWREVLEDGINA